MIYLLVRELAAAGARVRVPVAVTCRVLKIARQPYYRWLAGPVTTAELDPVDKDRISHRGRALALIAPLVAESLGA